MGKIKDASASFVRQFDRLNDGLVLVAGGIVAASALIVIFEVFMRYVLQMPTTWVNEISEMFLIYTTFFGAAWVLRMDGHTKVDILITIMSERRQVIMGIIQDIFSLFFCVVFAWLTWESFWDAVVTQERTAGGLFSIPLWIMYIVIPFGCLLLIVQLIIKIFDRFAHIPKKHTGELNAERSVE